MVKRTFAQFFGNTSAIPTAHFSIRSAGFYNDMFACIPATKSRGEIISNCGGEERDTWVSPLDIAEAIVEEMEEPFDDRKIRYVASDEFLPNELAKVPGEAIGKPDLKWDEVTDERQVQEMGAAEMNPHTAKGRVEMTTPRKSGRLHEDYYRNRLVLVKIKLADFARDFKFLVSLSIIHFTGFLSKSLW